MSNESFEIPTAIRSVVVGVIFEIYRSREALSRSEIPIYLFEPIARISSTMHRNLKRRGSRSIIRPSASPNRWGLGIRVFKGPLQPGRRVRSGKREFGGTPLRKGQSLGHDGGQSKSREKGGARNNRIREARTRRAR